MYRLYPESQGRHNNVFAVRMRGTVAEDAIRTALSRLARQHSMLRARFELVGDEPQQRVVEAPDVPLRVFHVEGLDAGALRERLTEDVLRPFDLSHEPAIRASLYKRSATESVFALCLDHLISDGWSYWRLLEEFGRLLSAARKGPQAVDCEAAGSPNTGVATYRDYIEWQRKWLSTPAAQKQLSYWQTCLEGELPVLVLPFARERSIAASSTSSFVTLQLSRALTRELKALAARHASTLFGCLLAGYQILLHRYSAQDDIVVGCPVPGRSAEHWDAVVGDFVNVIPVRARFDGGVNLSSVLRQTRNTALRGMAHQDYPFSRLVEQLHLARTAAEHPVFQTMFAFQNARGDGGLSRLWSAAAEEEVQVFWEDLELTPFYTHQSVGVGGIDLTLQILEVEEGLRCDFEFDASRFATAAIERLVRSFQTLLEGMVNADHRPVSELPLLSEAEKQQLLVGFNATQVEYERGCLVHRWFEEQVTRNPAAVAVDFGDQKLTYAELNRQANRVAHYLIGSGVQPDDRVAICTERGPEMVAGLLGILKSGAAYVPLDPVYPQARLDYMLSDCVPLQVLTQSRLRELQLAGQPDHNPDARALGLKDSHLAYVIYTSGSTGQPKGVMIEHRQLANLVQWHCDEFGLSDASRCSSVAAVGFDAATWEIWPVLSIGATLILAPPQADPQALLEWWSSQPLDVSFLPTPIAELAVSGGAVNPKLRTLLIGGDRLRSRLTGHSFAVVNNYGPTETTVVATSGRIDAADEVLHIGRPIANTQIYILDRHLQPVPIGVSGEIHVGGAQLARGYLHRAELTAQRFIDNPFGAGRLYKTGDLARWRANGTIEYLGRNDFQVKVRGFRIELGEIESQLSRCTGVREALVLARAGAGGDQQLVAYVVGQEGQTLSIERVRAQLAEHLAPYMVPSAFVVLDSLPLTDNGKVDRAALPAPDESAVAHRAYEEPVGEVERTLARIWQELLGVERVGRQDHFFEIGGHSLLGMQAVTRLSHALGVHVSLRELFSRPVLSSLAAGLTPAVGAQSGRIPLADRTGPLPMSLSQQRLWFLDQLDHGASLAYHIPAALRLQGVLNREALQAALSRITERHESLRTRMIDIEGMTYQVIDSPQAGFHLLEHDLSAVPPDQRERAVEQCRAVEASEPFDLSAGPLIRGRLLRLSELEHVLLVTQHHIVCDGWSLGVLMRELQSLYGAFSQGQPDPLPPLELQYADYAVWQRQCLQGAALEEQIAFWREELAGAPVLLALPSERGRPAVPSYSGGSVAVELSSELTEGLRGLARRHGITLFMTLLSGWSVLLARLSGQSEVVVGTPVANRDRPELEGMIGLFANTLALRVRLEEDPRVAELLGQVKSTALQAYAHQQVPFEQVVEALNPTRSLGHSPIFQVMLAFNNTPGGSDLSLAGLQSSVLEATSGASRFDLTLLLEERGAQIVGSLEYARDLFAPETIRRWVGYLQQVLSAMVLDDQRRVSELPLLSEAERQQLLVGFNATQVAYERGRLIHQWFEQQVERTAEAVAVEFAGQKLSYAQLNGRANQVAHFLIGSGVRPDQRVAICAERSLEIAVGLLGILKAGGAYVPLDPGYPRVRLQHILDDSAAVCVLTQSKLREVLPQVAVPLLLLDEGAQLSEQPQHNPDPRALGLKPWHLAYVIYTSGSTGQPKGVMNQHNGVVNRLLWGRDLFGLTEQDVVLQKTPYTFDVSVPEFFLTWLVGARLVLPQPGGHQDPTYLAQLIEERHITVAHFVPSMLQAFLDQADVSRDSRLRHVLCSGEALSAALQNRCLKCLPSAQLHNLYGPTEAAVEVTYWRCAEQTGPVPIGWPAANTQIYILDKHLQPVPIGVAGEIYIGGVQVARGYLNRAELTAQRFVENPYGRDNGRLYRSGDLGRWRADGAIEYLGRSDFQVKVRGFRIELGEVESALRSAHGVREAVVLVRESAARGQQLVAYVVGDKAQELSLERLRAHLAEQLAQYMVPSAFVVLESLPLTASGKLDRAALPEPADSALLRREYEAPVGEMEQTLARLWQELLGVEQVSRRDHFFDIGGHSLALTHLSFRIKELFGAQVRIAELYQMPQLQDMAAGIAQQRDRARQAMDAAATVTLEI